MPLDNPKRMAALQAKGAGAPPAEPPMAPPAMDDAPMDEPQGPPPGGPEMGGMPPAEQVVPQIADALSQLAAGLPDEQKQMVMSAVQQLQAAFPTNSPNSGGMSAEDSEAYGEPVAG